MRTPRLPRRGALGIELLVALAAGFGAGMYGFTEVSGLNLEMDFRAPPSLPSGASLSVASGAGFTFLADGDIAFHQPARTCVGTTCTTTWSYVPAGTTALGAGYLDAAFDDESIALVVDGSELVLEPGPVAGSAAWGSGSYVRCYEAGAVGAPSCALPDADVVCVAVEDGSVRSRLGFKFTGAPIVTSAASVNVNGGTEWVRPCPAHA